MSKTATFAARQWWDADWFELTDFHGKAFWLAGMVPPAMRADFGWTFHGDGMRCVA